MRLMISTCFARYHFLLVVGSLLLLAQRNGVVGRRYAPLAKVSPTTKTRRVQPPSMRIRWDKRLDSVQNLILLFDNPERPIFTMDDESDPAFSQALSAARLQMEEGHSSLPTVEVASTEELQVPSRSNPGLAVPVRLYYPPTDAASSSSNSLLPWTLYVHGGGFVQGSIATHDAFCRRLCVESGVVVASVGYRLAPEHKWPAQVDDTFDALLALSSGTPTKRPLDPYRVAVAGDSAGANIAAQLAARARDAKISLKLQLLLCPVLDATTASKSFDENAAGPVLTAAGMRWYWRRYLPQSDDCAKSASPLLMDAKKLAGLAPAYIVTAECDVLRDEGEEYARRLREAGVQVTSKCYDGAVHAFVVYANTPFALRDVALVGAARALREALDDI